MNFDKANGAKGAADNYYFQAGFLISLEKSFSFKPKHAQRKQDSTIRVSNGDEGETVF
jgi:hypothetical protein